MGPDVSPFAPDTACPEWKDTEGRSAKVGETSGRSGTCRGIPRCFGVPKLRHETARAGRRLSCLASPYLIMQSGLWHRLSADSGRESRTMECIKGRGAKLAGVALAFFWQTSKFLLCQEGKRTIFALSVKGHHGANSPLAFVFLTKSPPARSSRPNRGSG